ncbi:LPXTG-site transpeptidase (sortase) family protein [Microbacterium trichothecenolyticum]|uniref:sortase n=1 Tax=Microbacterium trichothecenolyticum TaxID=69370 RepID=UPI002863B956|nr:sortase [Microbacterium trichothecenolyticum]MDR7182982.1 LPXTG-site transpeptidase (sortase) family protein [Microbacterium trichothecenolyticum]
MTTTDAPPRDTDVPDGVTATHDSSPADPAPPRPPTPPRPPKPPKPPRLPRAERPPQPPRRMPKPVLPPQPLSPRMQLIRGALLVLAVLLLTLALNVMLLGQVRHYVAQQQLSDAFRAQLKEGIAPVSEGDFEDVLLADGAPVGILDIPALGVHEVIVEGTDSEATQLGPGHRRDTSLPGQAGVSVIMGRAAGYGGPFARIQELAPGDEFTIFTGQGEQVFEVIGLRYAGDPSPPRLRAGESRVVLTTARGVPYWPSGVARVDAQLVSETQPAGVRQSRLATLRQQERELSGDSSMVWALVFALQFLILVEVAAVWAYRNVGSRRTWIVFLPLTVFAGLWVTGEIVRLLPNLL